MIFWFSDSARSVGSVTGRFLISTAKLVLWPQRLGLVFTLLIPGFVSYGATAESSMKNLDTVRALFNGKDLEGWRHVGAGSFKVEKGLLKTEGGMGLLWFTGETFSNVELTVVYKVGKASDNSGVFVRIPSPPEEPWMPVYKAFEIQIDDGKETSDWHRTGTIYSMTKALAAPGKVNQWNTLRIRLEGGSTRVFVNDVLVTDYTEGDPVPPKRLWYEPERGPRAEAGYIGLQNHGSNSVVWFKKIEVAPL